MFAFGWLFGGSSEITAIEKEQKNFLFLVEDLCKHKILYIVYSQNKCHELPEFDPNDKSRQTMEILFQEMADALKNDICISLNSSQSTTIVYKLKPVNSISLLILETEISEFQPLSIWTARGRNPSLTA